MSFRNALACFILSFVTASVGHAADAQSPPVSTTSRDLAVIDATGKKVGNVLLASQFFVFNPIVPLLIGKQTVLFKVNKDGFFIDTSQSVQFESTDCSGPGFFWPDTRIIWPLATAGILYEGDVRTGNILYLADLMGTPKSIFVRSSFQIDSWGRERCDPANYDSVDKLIPSLPLIDFDKVFTPPYRLR